MCDVRTVQEALPERVEASGVAPDTLQPGETVTTPDGSRLIVVRLLSSDALQHVYEVSLQKSPPVEAPDQVGPVDAAEKADRARSEALDHPEREARAKAQAMDLPQGEACAETQAVDPPQGEACAETQAVDLPGTEARAEAEAVDPPLQEAPADTQAVDQPRPEARVEVETAVRSDPGAHAEIPVVTPAQAGSADEDKSSEAACTEVPLDIQVGAGPAKAVETLWLRVSADTGMIHEMEHAFDVLAAMKSPDVPAMRHIFREGAQTFLLSEALEGETLADTLARGNLDTKSRLAMMARIALAVTRLHEKGWLHLALRPDAILLVAGTDKIKLLDFSHAVRPGATPEAPIQWPGYSAPELATGGPAGAQADVYGLGALLYRIMCGSPIPESGPELLAGRLPCEVAGIPQILARCLHAEPGRRYHGASYLHRDLLRLLWRMRPGVIHRVEGATTIGLDPGRASNQDSWGFLSGRMQCDERTSTWSIFCVADGMGGMEAGDVASRTAVAALLTGAASLTQRRACFDGEEQMAMLRRWMLAANQRVVETLRELGAHGGTTMVSGFVVDRRLVVGHVGDSRAYLFRQGKGTLLTRDHSLAMMMVLQGQASADEIRTNPDRNRVTRSLGDRHPIPEWHVDSLQTITGSLVVDLDPDDVVMLCSDGIWEPVIEEQMEEILARHSGDPCEAAADFVARALGAGAPDNATVVLFQVRPRPPVFTPPPHEETASAPS